MLALVAGCSSEPAGSDAGPTDAGLPDSAMIDAGSADAGSIDAGPIDAGPPTIGSERDAIEGELTTLETMRDAVSPDTQSTAGFLELELMLGRLDAIVGKTGVLTAIVGKTGSMLRVSLPIPAIPALVSLRQLDRAIEEADALLARWESDDRAEVMAVRAALATVRLRLVSLRGLVSAFFRRALDAVPMGTGRLNEEYTDDRTLDVTGDELVIDVIGTGRASDGTVSVSLECPGVAGEVTGNSLDVESASVEVLGAMFLEGPIVFAIPARTDDTNVLRIKLDVPDVTGEWPTCRVSFSATRTLRGVLVDTTPEQDSTLDAERASWGGTTSRLRGELATLRTEGTGFDPELLDVLTRYAGEVSSDSSLLRGRIGQFETEDLELEDLMVSQVMHARAMRLASAPQLADAQFAAVRTMVGDMQTICERALGALSP